MKHDIQVEAEKAAKKIREALEEFNRVTGFAADVDARWPDSISLAALTRKRWLTP